jgi:hypothetical protein
VEVTYTLQPQDFEQLQTFISRRGGGISSRWMFPFVLVLAVCILTLNVLINPNRQRLFFQWRINPWMTATSTFLPLLLLAGLWFVLLRMGRTQQKEQWKTNPVLTQPHTTRVVPQHLYHRDATGKISPTGRACMKSLRTSSVFISSPRKKRLTLCLGALFRMRGRPSSFIARRLATGTKRAAPTHNRRFRSRKAPKGLIVSDDFAIHNAVASGRGRRILPAPSR